MILNEKFRMSLASNLNIQSSPKRLSVKIKNKNNNVPHKKCIPEYRSSSLEGWSSR